MAKKVLNQVQETVLIPLDLLEPFQDDIKYITPENLSNLAKNIVSKGFLSPFLAWKVSDESYKVLDGHQRLSALYHLRNSGYEILNVPCTLIDAKNETDAREKLLSLASYYGDASERGLREFVKTYKIDINKIQMRFPKISIKSLTLKEPEGSDTPKSSSSLDIVLTCKDPEVRAKVFEMLQDHEMSGYYEAKMK